MLPSIFSLAPQWPSTFLILESPLLQSSGVQNSEFGVQSCCIIGIFWIGYRFPFNRIWIIQMKQIVAMQKKLDVE